MHHRIHVERCMIGFIRRKQVWEPAKESRAGGIPYHQGYSGSMIREFVRPTHEAQETTKCTYSASSTSPLDGIPSPSRHAEWLRI